MTYFLALVRDASPLARSPEHHGRPRRTLALLGHIPEEISEQLYHTKIRQVFAEADEWLGKSGP